MKLSIIIIEYHCMDQVRACLESVGRFLSAVPHECIVLSNSCYDQETLHAHQAGLAGARLVAAPGNLGYAGGVNAALKHIQGDYVYILNPDVILTDGRAVDIIARMDADPEWAIAGPKVVDEHGDIQPSCRRFPKPWTFLLVRSFLSRLPGAALERERYFMSDYARDVPRCVDWVSGGAVLAKAAAIARFGGMDERYFLYMEDVDWCRSAWERGFKVVYCPESSVIHAGQHQSINIGLRVLKNRHLRWHLTSLFNYFMKFGWRALPDTDYYKAINRDPIQYASNRIPGVS